MADPPANGGTGIGPDRESTTGTPRWVKVFGVIATVAILLLVILMLTGRGGGHGPGRHTSGAAGGQTAPANATEHGVQQP
jgi:hypothetical protein